MEAADILDSIDIVQYISQYVNLEQRGREYWGLSCFTNEKTPSFSVDPEKGYWWDYSSARGGNLAQFVIEHDHVTIGQAIATLKRYAGITDDQQTRSMQRLAATQIAKKYRSTVKKPNNAIIKPLSKNVMQQYEFRREKLKLWVDEGISWESLAFHEVRYDSFDDRIVYPIKDYDGNIISVCGRTCDSDYKAKGLRKYTYKQQIGTLDTLYGFSDNRAAILEAQEIILFEGAKSCMKMYDWGFRNTSALLTSHLSIGQFRFLIRLCSYNNIVVTFALDADIDITNDKNIMRLCSYARVYWVKNQWGLLSPKDSPVDKGEKTWNRLYEARCLLT